MYRQPLLWLLAALLGSVYWWPPPLIAQEGTSQGEDVTISVDVEIVNILATVRDRKGRLINDLPKEAFVLEEDGKPQQIKYFAQQSDLPLTIGLLIDTSISQQRLIGDERRAGSQFFKQVLRHKKDLAYLISFDVDVELLQDLTESKRLLADGLDKLEVQGGGGGVHPGPVPTQGMRPGTVLFDAVYLASDEMMRGQVGRKAIVIISDGVDYGSRVKREEAIEAAHRSDVVLYGVKYYDAGFYYRSGGFGAGGALKKLARETGGNVFEVSRRRPLQQIFDQIQQELRSQYSLGYTPARDSDEPGLRRIKLKAKRGGLKVQSRKGYYPKPS